MSTPSSSVEPGPAPETHGAGAAAPASPDFTVANRLGVSHCTVALNATPGAIFLGSGQASRTDGNAPASTRTARRRQAMRWVWVLLALALALATAALAGYGFRGWREAQDTVPPRGSTQVDKALAVPAKSAQPLAAHTPAVTSAATTSTPLSDLETSAGDAARRQRIRELEAETATHGVSNANATPPVANDFPPGRDLWPAEEAPVKAAPRLPAAGAATRNVASAQQAKPGKTAVAVTRQAPAKAKAASCSAELSALQLCPAVSK